MTHEEFDKLVQTVEASLGRDTRALYRRVFWLAVLGYAGLLSPLLIVLAISLAFLVPGILWPEDALACLIIGAIVLVVGGWAAGRFLWVRLRAPEGRSVSRSEAPALFETLDDLRRRLRSSAFDRVLIVPEFNAAFANRPRLGVFGWNQYYLLAGLPLMESFSREEFVAVLAHECAHLSRRHHRSGQWIYRLRRSWEQVFHSLSKPRVAGEVSLRFAVKKFIDWFWPRFNAYAFVLSRTHEYQADATAAELAGPDNMAGALTRLTWHSRVLDDRLWPELWQSANSNAQPPDGVFLRLADSLKRINLADDEKWLDQAFNCATTNADTHPSLSDRLRTLGGDGLVRAMRQSPAPRPSVSAAEALLGPALPQIRSDVERLWSKDVETRWRQLHGRANALHERLGKLEVVIAGRNEDVDALWDKARVFLELHQPETAAPLLRQIIALDPGHVAANFNLGAFLLDEGNVEGEQFMERAVSENEELLPKAAKSLHKYYALAGQQDRIRELYVRLDRFEQSIEESRQERSRVTAADHFLPHSLGEAELAALRSALAQEGDVVAAHLAQKQLRHFSKQKLYLLCVRARRAWHGLPNADREQAAVNRLIKTAQLPGRVLIFAASGDFRGVGRKVRQVPGSLVYDIRSGAGAR